MGWYTTLATVVAAFAAASVFMPISTPTSHEAALAGWLLPLLRLGHLGSFAFAFGASVWTTFVAGVVLFRFLPRHQFGTVQSHLFPVYFRVTALAVAKALACFAGLHPLAKTDAAHKWQLGALAFALAMVVLNLVALEPATSSLMRERHRIEKAAGIGDEVGLSKNREVAKTNAELRAMNKRFGMMHGLSSLANLAALVAMAIHLYFLASRLATERVA